ncbi:hypothetical protein BDR26DRAFT_869155 [Obelidium mucronatum]|nr:hypothetical protein BDR26DRAFT_869155 [Obelidium mucronatum]
MATSTTTANAKSEADSWSFSTPQDTSAYLTGAQVTSSLAYALVFGVTKFIVNDSIEPVHKQAVTLALQVIISVSYIAKVVQMYVFKQASTPWNYRLPRELGAFAAGCQQFAIGCLVAVFYITNWWFEDFPEEARQYISWCVGGVAAVAYLLRVVALYVAVKKQQAQERQSKKKE